MTPEFIYAMALILALSMSTTTLITLVLRRQHKERHNYV